MQIVTLTTSYLGSHCYLVIENGHALVIDPGDAQLVKQAIDERSLIADVGILTHEHCDHIYGCSQVRDWFHCKMISSRKCNENMQDSRKNSSKYFGEFVGIQTKVSSELAKGMEPFTTHADEVFDSEMVFDWLGHRVLIHETPGHSQGSVCIIIDDSVLFSGDTIFKDEKTETKFAGGSKIQFQTVTLPWLTTLSPDITVYPGHGETFILADWLEIALKEADK